MARMQPITKAPTGVPTLPIAPSRSPLSRRTLACQAKKNGFQDLGKAAVAFTLASCAATFPFPGTSLASEFDILTLSTPTTNYVVDDAKVLSRSTEGNLNKRLSQLEETTGYRVEVATVRKLEFETDAFSFGDKVIEKWYPTVEEGTNKGILLIVTTAKDGALTGGPAFLRAVGDDLIDSVVGDQIPILTEEEKYNETVLSSVSRIEAILNGKEDPGGPTRKEVTRKRTYRTKEETKKVKGATSTIVISLLVIAVVVPMLQYYGYTAKE